MKRVESIIKIVTINNESYEISNDNGRFKRLYIYKMWNGSVIDLDPIFPKSFADVDKAETYLRNNLTKE